METATLTTAMAKRNFMDWILRHESDGPLAILDDIEGQADIFVREMAAKFGVDGDELAKLVVQSFEPTGTGVGWDNPSWDDTFDF
jgi:hypothetical protein